MRDSRDEELDAQLGQGKNYLRDDIATLRFTFVLPIAAVRLAVQDAELATYICKVKLAVPPAPDGPSERLKIRVNEQVRLVEVTADETEMANQDEEVEIEDARAEEGELELSWENGRGELYVTSVELLARSAEQATPVPEDAAAAAVDSTHATPDSETNPVAPALRKTPWVSWKDDVAETVHTAPEEFVEDQQRPKKKGLGRSASLKPSQAPSSDKSEEWAIASNTQQESAGDKSESRGPRSFGRSSFLDKSELGERRPKEDLLEKIKREHARNNLYDTYKQVESRKKYQGLAEFKLPLNDLYELEAACLNTEGIDAVFCATLLRIKDRKIIRIVNEKEGQRGSRRSEP